MFAVVCVHRKWRRRRLPKRAIAHRTEIDRVDVRCVPGKRAQFAPRRYVPNLDRIITAARAQESTVPTKSHLRNTFAVGLEFPTCWPVVVSQSTTRPIASTFIFS